MNRIGVGTFSTTSKMREYVNDVLDTGRISYGPYSRKFEAEFASIHDSKYAILSNSGTSSLQVALQALIEVHDFESPYVAIPAITFVATANIVIQCNMIPVVVDVDPRTYNMNPIALEKVMDEFGCSVIIPVHLFGQPADMTAIMEIANEYDAKVIEDSCECMFATHSGKSVGSFGDIACFSTYVAHLVTTGVGGISITSNDAYARAMRSLVNHGRDGIYISIDDSNNPFSMERRFRFDHIGYSYRITEIEAALGLAQIEDGVWKDMIAKRQNNASALSCFLKPMENDGFIKRPTQDVYNTHSWMMYPIVVTHGDKWKLCEYLEENGIETREMLPLTGQPAYVKHPTISGMNTPVADWIDANGFYVGCHQDLGESDMNHIAETIAKFYYG